MAIVHGFDNPEDLMAYIAGQRERMVSSIKPWQRRIDTGGNRYGLTVHNEGEELLFVYTEILPDEEDGNLIEGSHVARHCSQWETKGELGMIHVSAIDCILTEEQHKRCELADWPTTWESFLRSAYNVNEQKEVCIPCTVDGEFRFKRGDGSLVHALVNNNAVIVISEVELNKSIGQFKWTIVNDWCYAVDSSVGAGNIAWMAYPQSEGGWLV